MGKVVAFIKQLFSPYQSPVRIWQHKLWKGNYDTQPEKLISPYIRDSKYLYFFSWVFVGISLLGEFLVLSLDENNIFGRSGAILVAAGIVIELKMLRTKSSIQLIYNGNISPRGYLTSAHMLGPFTSEWTNEKVNDVPVSMWLMGQENTILKYERRVFWMVVIGTLIWAYGDLIV
jgi:hypothetical protein